MQVWQPDIHDFVYDTNAAIHCEKVTYITALPYFKHCTNFDGTAMLCK